ncbi:MAG: hypothetical protein HOD92_24015 [Deltaproteobacteria bacterium]|jgi:hypothetical protein|nr:hypothetical protein [Deltaproteobacteria bacterium]MBT4527590.1 hypothetical protein [Deltaproteobacteria bacterium]
MPKIPQKDIKMNLEQLLSSEEGIVTVLAASLVLSDFDDPMMAITEATKAYNSNRIYFKRIIEIWKKK